MRTRIHSVLLPSEVGDFAEEVRRVFLELGRTFGAEAMSGGCSPAVDVFETDKAVEIVVDLPGVDTAAVRVFAKGDTVLIVGEKVPQRTRGESTFHLVERGFGRFARTVRIDQPCNSANVTATLSNGELRVSVPKMADRRGQTIQVPVKTA
jgi:HSP20 family protein